MKHRPQGFGLVQPGTHGFFQIDTESPFRCGGRVQHMPVITGSNDHTMQVFPGEQILMVPVADYRTAPIPLLGKRYGLIQLILPDVAQGYNTCLPEPHQF